MSRAVDAVAAALRRFDGARVELLVGEPCFGPPPELLEAFARVASEPGSVGYGPAGGLRELRALLAARDDDGGDGPEHVMVTHGAKGGLLVLLATLIEAGDEVIHPTPCYPAYPDMVRRFGGVPVAVAEHGDGFAGWAEAVAGRLGPRTRAVVLASPSNPTGTTLNGAVLEALVALCRERGVRLVLDEAYAAFRHDAGGGAVHQLDPGRTTVARIRSASKSLALCGWRIGWIMTDSRLVRRVESVQAALLNPPATPPQRALLELDRVPASYFERNRQVVRERLEAMAGALRRAGFDAAMPAGGFYLWVDAHDRLDGLAPDTATWCESLASEHGVGLWPGEDFGGPGRVRLALPQGDDWPSEVAELERRLRAFCG